MNKMLLFQFFPGLFQILYYCATVRNKEGTGVGEDKRVKGKEERSLDEVKRVEKMGFEEGKGRKGRVKG